MASDVYVYYRNCFYHLRLDDSYLRNPTLMALRCVFSNLWQKELRILIITVLRLEDLGLEAQK